VEYAYQAGDEFLNYTEKHMLRCSYCFTSACICTVLRKWQAM